MTVIDKTDRSNWVKEVKHVRVIGLCQSLGGYDSYMNPTFEDIAGGEPC